MIRSALSILLIGLLAACSDSSEGKVVGKWYTYADSGDYMELWLGEDKAISYLGGIDEFLLYDLSREGNKLKFNLIESRVINEHSFELHVTKSSEELLQTIFISETKIDSLKTYFVVSNATPDIKGSLEANAENMQELFSRMEGSHAGHGH